VTSREWLESDPYELYVQFHEDHFLSNPEEARDARLKYLGYEVAPTGDPLVDKWNTQLDRGETPDLSEGEDERAKRRDEWVREQAEKHFRETGELLFVAPLPEEIQLIEKLKKGEDPYNIEVMGAAPADELEMDDLMGGANPEAFDEFMSMANLYKGR